jgi:hypothetical protein
MRFASPILLCLALWTLPASAQILYANGPVNGETYAWTINYGYIVSDTFTLSGGNSAVTGLSFGAWLYPGDTLTSADVSITSRINSGTTYFDETVVFSASRCAANSYGYDVCTETGSFSGPTLLSGTYWLNLQNAVTTQGNQVYWDQNSGVGCRSLGCPSQGWDSNEGPVPSESFSVLGSANGTTPEPGSIVLFGTGILVGITGILRRKLS